MNVSNIVGIPDEYIKEAIAIVNAIDLSETCDVTIPPKFAADHESRELPSGKWIAQTSRGVTYNVNRYVFFEWLSDARYYSDCGGQGWDLGDRGEALGMQSSARATVKRLSQHPNYTMWHGRAGFTHEQALALDAVYCDDPDWGDLLYF